MGLQYGLLGGFVYIHLCLVAAICCWCTWSNCKFTRDRVCMWFMPPDYSSTCSL
jgi:hypothetical protein